jgi:D-hydroxyproline dehydrogenase subunit beta
VRRYDLAVVGGGIVGLAHALAAARRGMRVVLIDRDERANGASIRNFGFITVTGQSQATWQRARRSRDVWEEVAPLAGFSIVHRNECVIVHSTQALAVLEEFVAGPMCEGCELLDADEVIRRVPMANPHNVTGALWSPHDVRVEPRVAIPALANYLERELGVTMLRPVFVRSVCTPQLETNAGTVLADRVVVAPGPDLTSLFPEIHARYATRLCKLHMLRLTPQPAAWRLPTAIMSDFALVRYRGFSALPAAAPLRSALERRAPHVIAYGIHLIVVQNADGSLIVGDSHDYGATGDPFFSTHVEEAMLELCRETLNVPSGGVIERWIGFYPQSDEREWFVDAPDEHTRLVQVTTGNGMSTAFALAEEVIEELGAKRP